MDSSLYMKPCPCFERVCNVIPFMGNTITGLPVAYLNLFRIVKYVQVTC